MKVHADLNLSIDGFGSPRHPTPEEPLGEDWFRLVDSYTAARTFRERVLGDTAGAGATDQPPRPYPASTSTPQPLPATRNVYT